MPFYFGVNMNKSQRVAHNAKAVLTDLLNAATTTNTNNKRICFTEQEFNKNIAHLKAIIELSERD
jgi:hypothetical protein